TTATIHDVSDAFMKFRVSDALGSFFQFYWRGGCYQFSRMIYGSSIAPSCLEGGMAHVEAGLAPAVERPLPSPVFTSDGTVDLCLDDIVDFDDSEPEQCSFMDDILDFRDPPDSSASDPLIDTYHTHDLPLKTQSIADASASSPIPVLGLELIDSGDSLRYPAKAVDQVLRWP
ncbi:hypothetical protein FOZ62_022240, partial [Perkinsus olseni]